MRYVIGIDSGATKSEAVIMPAVSGAIPERAGWGNMRFDAINYNVLGYEKTKKRLTEIIKKAVKRLGFDKIDMIVAGLSGARFEKDRKRLEKEISSALGIKKLKIFPDIEIAFASVFEPKDKNCGILIAGTGSILYYKDSKGKTKRAGGWGRHIGDEGSGYWIAREALRRVTQHYDVTGRYTSLLKVIRNEFSITRDTITEEIYHKGFEISSITPLVFSCAQKGDAVAKEIIMGAAEGLAHHFLAIGRIKTKVALVGSLFTRERLLEKYLRQIVRKSYPHVELIKPTQPPVWGAVKIALSTLRTK